MRDTVAIHLIVNSGERSTPCGCPFFSHVVEGRSPEDPWTRQRKQSRDTLAGSYTLNAASFPGVFGTSCLDTRSKKR